MDDKGEGVEFDQDVEDLARRLFALGTKGVDPWGLELLSSEKRSNFFKSWETADDATRRSHRKQARQVITARHKRDPQR